MIDEEAKQVYDPGEDRLEFDSARIGEAAGETMSRIQSASRPVILAGAGIRLAGACDLFRKVIDQLQVPVLAAWDAIDIIPSDDPLYFGRPSTLGQRAANFVFQNADLLLSIGCRLNLRQIGYTFPSVARAAYKIIVDIDPAELRKPTIRADLPVHCDAKLFLEAMCRCLGEKTLAPPRQWTAWCRELQNRYPVVLPEFRAETGRVNPYVFCDVLSDCLAADDVVVSGDGAACIMPIQVLRVRRGQRHIVNSGCAAMGYGLSAAIGACFARGKRRVVCLEGDGSFQLNIQELQTVVHHQLPLKIFIFDNDGYLSIRATQKNFFEGRLVGESSQSGVSFPDLTRVAEAYGIKAMRVSRHAELANSIGAALDFPGPVLCNVHMSPAQGPVPRVASQRLPNGKMVSSPLEDMSPLLEREEFLSNMLIPPWES
jgi:acetolactate synthase-1/2/3 large subunit